jgi:hypothetical protein
MTQKPYPLSNNWLNQTIMGMCEVQQYKISTGGKMTQKTLPIVKQLAQSDDNGNVRGAAVQELARGWKDDPETLPIVKHWLNQTIMCATSSSTRISTGVER